MNAYCGTHITEYTIQDIFYRIYYEVSIAELVYHGISVMWPHLDKSKIAGCPHQRHQNNKSVYGSCLFREIYLLRHTSKTQGRGGEGFAAAADIIDTNKKDLDTCLAPEAQEFTG